MKELYRVQYMSESDYRKMMEGGYDYSVHEEIIPADNAAEAVEICKNLLPAMVVREHAVRVMDFIQQEAAMKAEREAKEKKEAEKKAAKAKWEAEHPEEVNEKKRQANIKRYKRLIEKQKEEIAEQEKELARLERKLKELEG